MQKTEYQYFLNNSKYKLLKAIKPFPITMQKKNGVYKIYKYQFPYSSGIIVGEGRRRLSELKSLDNPVIGLSVDP